MGQLIETEKCRLTPTLRLKNCDGPVIARSLFLSERQRIRAQLEVIDLGPRALPTFHVERRAVAARRPNPPAFPTGIGIVDATVHALDVEAERIGYAQRYELAVD